MVSKEVYNWRQLRKHNKSVCHLSVFLDSERRQLCCHGKHKKVHRRGTVTLLEIPISLLFSSLPTWLLSKSKLQKLWHTPQNIIGVPSYQQLSKQYLAYLKRGNFSFYWLDILSRIYSASLQPTEQASCLQDTGLYTAILEKWVLLLERWIHIQLNEWLPCRLDKFFVHLTSPCPFPSAPPRPPSLQYICMLGGCK